LGFLTDFVRGRVAGFDFFAGRAADAGFGFDLDLTAVRRVIFGMVRIY
jgi:hypothetical protein